MRRRILLVSYLYPPDPSVGSHRWAAMAPNLRELGVEVTVVTTGFYGSLDDDGSNVVRTRDLRASPLLRFALRRPSAVQLAAAPAPAPSLLRSGLVPDGWLLSWMPFALAATRRALRAQHFDCVVTNNPPDSTHLIGLLLGPNRPAWIADFEDGWRFEPIREPWPTRLQDRIDARMEARVARSADVVVGVTRPIADDFAARFRVDARHITLGWDPALDPIVAAARPPQLPQGCFNIVYTGNLTHPARRDPSGLFEAMGRLAVDAPELAGRLRLVLAGPLSAEERGVLRQYRLEGIVEHVGLLGRAEAIALQRQADALLLIATGPHRSQISGKVFEYLASGRPIIVIADENEAARIVAATGTGIVLAPTDVDGIVATLREAVTTGLARHYRPHGLDQYRFPAPAREFAQAVEAAIEHRAARA